MTVRLIPYLVMNGNAKEAIQFWGFLPIPPKRYIKGVFEHPPKKGNSTLAFTITVAYKNKRSKRL